MAGCSVWGWNGGRTRAIADTLAAEDGYKVVVPKFLQPELEGGTDGDGLPPDFDMAARSADFGPWVSAIPWKGNLDAKMGALLEKLSADGAAKIGMVGFCWGGWAGGCGRPDGPISAYMHEYVNIMCMRS